MKKILTVIIFSLFICVFSDSEFAAVGFTATPPVIDGNLDDLCWKNAVELTNFIKLGTSGQAAKRITKVYLTFDKNNLYIGTFCREEILDPVFNKLHEFRANVKTNDSTAIWKDDMMEFFFAPDINNIAEYFHFAFNSNGTVFDAKKMNPKDWTSGAKIAARKVIKGAASANDVPGWCAEIAIPFSSMKISAPENGTEWNVNFCRKAVSIGEVSSWTQTSGRFHDPASFGTIEFRNHISGVDNISSLTNFTNGRNIFSYKGNRILNADVIVEFPNEKVHFSHKGKGEKGIPVILDPENKAYRFTASDTKDITETFLRTGSLNFVPGETYTVTLRTKTNYTATLPKGYPFLTIVQKKGGYQVIPIQFPKTTGNEWVTLSAQFKDKGNSSGSLWGIKWAKRNIKGQVWFDDISITENKTGRNILDNGNFASGSRNWNIFNKKNVLPGYGHGAESAKIHYEFKNEKNELLYRSPEYKIKLSKKNSTINSSIVQFGYDGLIPLEQFQICAGTMERFNLYLMSDCRNSFEKVKVTLTLPWGLRLLAPEKNTVFPAIETINEKIISKNGNHFRQYTLTVPKESVNNSDTDFRVAAGIPIYLFADTPARGVIGNIEYQAELNSKRKEQKAHLLKMTVLEPPAGFSPSHKLPLILWAHIDSKEGRLMNQSQRQSLIRKCIVSGYNLAPGSVQLVKESENTGLRIFPMLPSITLSGPYFPYAQEFVKKHPEYAGVNAFGKKTQTVDPAVLLSKDNPFKPYMEKVFTEFMKYYPDEFHVDYEASFMPVQKGKLPAKNSINGFSDKNLALFRRKYRIKGELTPSVIYKKYAKEWIDFRSTQNAEILGLYKKYASELKKNIRFSVYSGYPPQSLFYGINWQKLSRLIDLCMVGYGGDDALMLREIKQNFYNTGLLLMGHVDTSQITNHLTSMLCNAGSYMCYLHHTTDGSFFRNSSIAAGLAAAFEPFFLDLKHTRKNHLTVDAKNGKGRGDVYTFRKDGKTVVMILNTANIPSEITLRTQDISGLTAIQFSSRNTISHKNGTYTVTVPPRTSDAVYFCKVSDIPAPEVPQIHFVQNLEYPVFFWKANDTATSFYEVRYASTEEKLNSAKEKTVTESRYQIPEKLNGNVFFQLRTVSVNGKKSPWSKPVKANAVGSQLLSYRFDPDYPGSLQKSRITQFFSWGGGQQFAEGFVDSNTVAPGDKASFCIKNSFDTTNSYWTISRQNGCHFMLPECVPGEKYFFKTKVKTNGTGKAVISITALDEKGNFISTVSSKAISGNNNWTQISVTRILPPKTKYVNLYLNYSGIGTAWFSDIQNGKMK